MREPKRERELRKLIEINSMRKLYTSVWQACVCVRVSRLPVECVKNAANDGNQTPRTARMLNSGMRLEVAMKKHYAEVTGLGTVTSHGNGGRSEEAGEDLHLTSQMPRPAGCRAAAVETINMLHNCGGSHVSAYAYAYRSVIADGDDAAEHRV